MGRQDWDALDAWNESHKCADCGEYEACPCGGCEQGWCHRVGGWTYESEPCCGDGYPRFEKR